MSGLGGADTARLFATDGTTLLDSYAWTVAASTTYGRCPGSTGDFTTTAALTKGTANNCGFSAPTGLVFNEVESNGDLVGDFAEIKNTGTVATDISGYVFRDADDVPDDKQYVVPDGTVVAPGGYYVLAEATFGFGLGSADSVRLFGPGRTPLVASYSWTAHAAVTWGRCPDGTGALIDTTSSTRGAANDCDGAVRINEVESNGDATDWIELTNAGTTSVDLGGWIVKDNSDASALPIPAGTTLDPGRYLAVDTDLSTSTGPANFGLGANDSARLFRPDGTTLVASYSWTAHATTTYGRCPDRTGAFATTAAATKAAANTCASTGPGGQTGTTWPGGAEVRTVDPATLITTQDASGLAYEGSGTSAPGTLWAVENNPGTLYKLQRTGSTWGPAAGDWATGKTLRFPDGTGNPDSEGVTFAGAGSSAGMFVATERNNDVGGTSRPAILRYDPNTAGTTLTAVRDWNLSTDLPGLGANLGLEGIAYVPDSYLVAGGFRTQAGALYDPAAYPGHGDGLFFVGVEANGMVYAYALDQGSNAFTRVASFASGLPSVMELSWEPKTQKLWVVCDDTCQGQSSRFGLDATGAFTAGPYLSRPAGMPNLNNEGFATAPQSECVAGLKPVFWADDGDTDGFSLREGTLACTTPAGPVPPPVTTPPVVVPPAPPATDVIAPRVRVKGVKNGGFYPGKPPRPRCVATDARSAATCTLTRSSKRIGERLKLVTVVATGSDAAGNSATARKTYVVRRG